MAMALGWNVPYTTKRTIRIPKSAQQGAPMTNSFRREPCSYIGKGLGVDLGSI